MLSYQHLYHAGNLADVHKHAALAWVLDYMTRKPKPVTYIETHAGRGLYDLAAAEAVKTGEAAAGIEAVGGWFSGDDPYGATLARCRAAHGATAYPGSPWIAADLLRDSDQLHLAELHPRERAALEQAVPGARIHGQDGFALAQSLSPPDPRRGLMLVDPSYEVKADYSTIPAVFRKIAKAWPVGVLILWYPVLTDARHDPMLTALQAGFPDGLRHEVRFPPARKGHGMIGSGLFLVNPPWGLDGYLDGLTARFDAV